MAGSTIPTPGLVAESARATRGPGVLLSSPELLLLPCPRCHLTQGDSCFRTGIRGYNPKHFFRTEIRNRPILLLKGKEGHLLSHLLTLQASQACLGVLGSSWSVTGGPPAGDHRQVEH